MNEKSIIPTGKIDVVLDTDAYNEIDDQFAIAYLLNSGEKLNTVAIYAAPFKNGRSYSPLDGMEKSYDEIIKLLKLAGKEDMADKVFKGSGNYLKDENTATESDAANDLIKRAENYSPENPLYVVAIGAITNIASAFIKKPSIAKNIVVVWLGGHAIQPLHWENYGVSEFNMNQDIAAARVVMSSAATFVQLPCRGVVSEFRISKPELEYWLMGKNPVATYLAENTILEAESYAKGKAWTRVIWDVTAVAWLLNENGRFMRTREIDVHLPCYDHYYEHTPIDKKMVYVEEIERDELMTDLIRKLTDM